uniref:Uncharacterized protein n=1 Tax=Opuntia streptacantha TaxID=393608 RepID=A0A7C9DY92_OPUST
MEARTASPLGKVVILIKPRPRITLHGPAATAPITGAGYEGNFFHNAYSPRYTRLEDRTSKRSTKCMQEHDSLQRRLDCLIKTVLSIFRIRRNFFINTHSCY